MIWIPIITDLSLIYKIEDKLNKIDQILRTAFKNSSSNLDFYGGEMGQCLFLYYYNLYKKRKNIIDYMLIQIISQVQKRQQIMEFSHYGWLIQHLKFHDFIHEDVNIILSEIDEFLLKKMIIYIKANNYDLLYGATNIGCYFYKRYQLQGNFFERHLTDYVTLMKQQAVAVDSGLLGWKTLIEVENGQKQDGFNLGFAHGIPSIIAFLSKIRDLGICQEMANSLLIKVSGFLLSKEQNATIYGSHFSGGTLLEREITEQSRLGWCYGDLTIGYALLVADLFKKNYRKITEILYDTIKRTDFDSTYVVDASLCHGTSGLAHIYNRLYQRTSDVAYKEASLFWYLKTINEFEYDGFPAGYRTKSWNGFIADYSFINGISGIGLSLLAGISDLEPSWDEFLLLS